MNDASLRAATVAALAEIGIGPPEPEPGRPRKTTWLPGAHGIGIRSYVSGRRVYIAQARMGGRIRTVTIGPAGVLTEAQAISVARRVLALALVGENPAAKRIQARSAPLWPAYLEEYWDKVAPSWKPTTRAANDIYRRTLLDDAFPRMGIDAITEADVSRWFAKATRMSGPGGANRCIAILSAMMTRAERWGYRRDGVNPCRRIKRNPGRKCERHLSEVELATLGAVLRRRRNVGTERERLAVTIITLLLLTGCRKSEVLDLCGREVRGQRLQLIDSKVGPRTVWLGDQARALIESLPKARGDEFVFAGDGWQLSKARLEDIWQAVRREAGLEGVRLHDLRHTFASHAAMRAETLPMIGKLLGHAKIGSTARYAHIDDAGVTAANELIGAVLSSQLSGHRLVDIYDGSSR